MQSLCFGVFIRIENKLTFLCASDSKSIFDLSVKKTLVEALQSDFFQKAKRRRIINLTLTYQTL